MTNLSRAMKARMINPRVVLVISVLCIEREWVVVRIIQTDISKNNNATSHLIWNI